MVRNKILRYAIPAIAAGTLATTLFLNMNARRIPGTVEQTTTQQSNSLERIANEESRSPISNSENLGTRRYIVASEEEGFYDGFGNLISFSQGQYLEIDGDKIAYFQTITKLRGMDQNKVGTFVVPGIVASEEYKTKYGTAVDVKPIEDPLLRERVKEKLATRNNVSFW